MNEALFPSRKDAVIANQRCLIARYQKFDKERTRKYNDLVEKYNQLAKEVDWYREENKILENKLNGKDNGD